MSTRIRKTAAVGLAIVGFTAVASSTSGADGAKSSSGLSSSACAIGFSFDEPLHGSEALLVREEEASEDNHYVEPTFTARDKAAQMLATARQQVDQKSHDGQMAAMTESLVTTLEQGSWSGTEESGSMTLTHRTDLGVMGIVTFAYDGEVLGWNQRAVNVVIPDSFCDSITLEP